MNVVIVMASMPCFMTPPPSKLRHIAALAGVAAAPVAAFLPGHKLLRILSVKLRAAAWQGSARLSFPKFTDRVPVFGIC